MSGTFIKAWLPVVLWMGFIFFMSTDVGAAPHTGGLLEPLLRWIHPGISAEAIEWAHFVVRKCGHLSEYAVLALLTWRALWLAGSEKARSSAIRCAAWAWLIATVYAGTDEFHQWFVPTRTASVRDVMIDSCGAAIGLTLLLVLRGWRIRVAARR